MHMVRRFGIAGRLFLAFAFIAALSLASAGVGWWILGDVEEAQTTIVERAVGLRDQYDDALPPLCDDFRPVGLIRIGQWINIAIETAPGDERQLLGKVQLLQPTGVSVMSS